ncbi:MAG: carboxypeptidase-like regulatory domain-containing protein [Bacteroidales bacterium]
MKKTLYTIAFIAFIGMALAGNHPMISSDPSNSSYKAIALSGSVVDFNSGEVLTGVEVKIEGTDIITYTDFDGNFEFNNMMPGNYNLIASFISYNNSLIENFKAEEGENTVEIKLQHSK